MRVIGVALLSFCLGSGLVFADEGFSFRAQTDKRVYSGEPIVIDLYGENHTDSDIVIRPITGPAPWPSTYSVQIRTLEGIRVDGYLYESQGALLTLHRPYYSAPPPEIRIPPHSHITLGTLVIERAHASMPDIPQNALLYSAGPNTFGSGDYYLAVKFYLVDTPVGVFRDVIVTTPIRISATSTGQGTTETPKVEAKPETPWKSNAYGDPVQYVPLGGFNLGYQFIPQVDGKITKVGALIRGKGTIHLYDSEGAYQYLRDPLPKTFGHVKIVSSVWGVSEQMPTNALPTFMYGQADIEFVPNQ